MDVLKTGDEVRCPRCNDWHRVYVKYPDERVHNGAHALYYECPKASASFSAGRIGDVPRDVKRWRRPTSLVKPV